MIIIGMVGLAIGLYFIIKAVTKTEPPKASQLFEDMAETLVEQVIKTDTKFLSSYFM